MDTAITVRPSPSIDPDKGFISPNGDIPLLYYDDHNRLIQAINPTLLESLEADDGSYFGYYSIEMLYHDFLQFLVDKDMGVYVVNTIDDFASYYYCDPDTLNHHDLWACWMSDFFLNQE